MAELQPAGGLSLSIAAVRVALAACPTWQSWTRVTSAPEGGRAALASKRIHLFALPGPADQAGYTPDELDALRPCCGLTFIPPAFRRASEANYRRIRNGAESFIERSNVFIHIVETVDPTITLDNQRVILGFTNRLGQLIDDLPGTCEVEGAAFFQAIEVVAEPNRATEVHKGTQGDFVQAMLRVETGLSG